MERGSGAEGSCCRAAAGDAADRAAGVAVAASVVARDPARLHRLAHQLDAHRCGRLRRSRYSGLLFYAHSAGVGEFYSTDGFGGIALLRSHADWRTSWTQIVPLTVRQSGAAYGSGLLFYDPAAGLGAFYATDGEGNLILLAERTGWRDSWTTIVAGHLTGSSYSDLLFYDQASGAGALYSTDGAGGMNLVAEHAWNPGWTDILVQRFRSVGGDQVEGRHDVLFYAGATGDTELYEVLGTGNVNSIGSTTLAADLPFLTPGAFGAPFTSVLTYDAVPAGDWWST